MPHTHFDLAIVGDALVAHATALACANAGLRVLLTTSASSSSQIDDAANPTAHAFAPHTPHKTGNDAEKSRARGFSASLSAPLPSNNLPSSARVYALNAASVAFLKTLRVWSQLENNLGACCPVQHMAVVNAPSDHHSTAHLHFSAYAHQLEHSFPDLAVIVSHDVLAQALQSALEMNPNIQQSAFRATDCVLDGTPATWRVQTPTQLFSADCLVGADGAHSAVRTQVGIVATRIPFEQAALTATLRCSKPHHNTAFQWFTPQGIVALLPLPDAKGAHRVSLVWSATTAHAHSLMATYADQPQQFADALMHAIATQKPAPLGALECVSTPQLFPLHSLRAHAFVTRAAALVGDAAHVIHPLLGQGLNLGLQDAQAFAQTQAQRPALRSAGDETVLRRYARARSLATQALHYTTRALAQFEAPLPAEPATDTINTRVLLPTGLHAQALLKNYAMNFSERIPVIKRLLVRAASGQL